MGLATIPYQRQGELKIAKARKQSRAKTAGSAGKVRIGVIGCGSLANSQHYPSLTEMRDVQVVALCDILEPALNATGDKFNISNRYTDYRKMIEKHKLDCVFCILRPQHLYDIVMHLLRNKLHVFIEKPPGVTRYQTESMARVARENKCLTMVGFNRRFMPMLVQAKKAVERKGPMNACVATFYKDGKAAGYDCYAMDILSCDTIHAVDSLRWMAGSEAKSVASCVATYDDVAPNSYYTLVRFENGVTGVLLANWATGGRVHTFEMHTRGASAFLNPSTEGVLNINGKTKVVTTQEAAGSDQNRKYYGFYGEDHHFIDCIKKKKQPVCNFDDAAKTMALVEAIYQNSI